MVTNSRSVTSGTSVGSGLMVRSGGCSDGHTKLRSTRGCAPGLRCTLKRIEAGGMLKAMPPMVIGKEGASGAIAAGAGHTM